jgi:hypothetical protein
LGFVSAQRIWRRICKFDPLLLHRSVCEEVQTYDM